jgi:hypothetical protein
MEQDIRTNIASCVPCRINKTDRIRRTASYIVGISGMHDHAWLTQIVRMCEEIEQVEVACEPMHVRGAFKEPVASFFDIFPQD